MMDYELLILTCWIPWNPVSSKTLQSTIAAANTEVLYGGKFSKGLIFENFEGSQAFLKVFFRNQ